MRTIDRRLVKLELRLLPSFEDLTEERAIVEMLIAGECQMVLQVLEHQDTRLVKEWQSKGRRAYGPALTKFNFRDRTQMIAAVNAALCDVPEETRYHIAALLMAADARLTTEAAGKR